MKILTLKQCSHITGGDPGMSLAGVGGGGEGGGGFYGGGVGMALAGMGVGIEGGPMAVVTVEMPMPTSLGDFDKVLIGAAGGSAASFTTAVGGWALGGAAILVGPAVAVGVAAVVVGGAVGYGAMRLIQYANDDMKYAGHVRHAIP
ncbi:MAG: hypothetical protein JWR07_3178 [Nevskia sp.]|nr:hypothetical protein [Nevskia sp.]